MQSRIILVNRSVRLLLLLLLCIQAANAYHIAGAEFSYRCLGNYRYEFSFKFYRDCSSDSAAPFDGVIPLYVFTRQPTQAIYLVREVPRPDSIRKIIPDNLTACVFQEPRICQELGIYTTIIELPPRIGGYDVMWQRCCRNPTISNLELPLYSGLTILARIPGSELLPNGGCNSMPVFNNRPPIFLCLNQTLNFDLRATDPDGDSLVYKLTDPYDGKNRLGQGTSNSRPALSTRDNPPGAGPYAYVNFLNGYNYLQPFGPGTITAFDSLSGNLRIRPNAVGIFVACFSVFEYRNGKLLSENKFDLQFYVLPCRDFGQPPVLTRDLSGNDTLSVKIDTSSSIDTLTVWANFNFCYTVKIQDDRPTQLRADVITPNGVSGMNVSTTVTPASLEFRICWTPACELINRTLPIIIRSYDQSDCLDYNVVFDTLIIRVVSPPRRQVITHVGRDSQQVVNQVIRVMYGDTICFPYTVSSWGGIAERLSLQVLAAPADVNLPIVTQNLIADTLRGTICWVAGCSGVDTTVQFIVQGAYRNFCPPFSISNDTISLHVKEAYNPAPTITLDAGGLVKYNDTIAAVVNNTYCFRYRITDSLPRSNLARRVKVERADGSPIPASLPIWDPPYTQSDTVIEGQICWLATCAALGLVRIVVGVEDSLECRINHWRSDTIWFRVRELPNPPPFLAVSPPLLPQNADTFLLNAEQTVCFGFTIKDQQPMGRLKIAARAERISVEPVAAINLVLRNLKLVSDTILTGELCWQAPCRPLRATYRIVVELIDSNSCTLSHRLLDTLFVQVLPQPPGPIALVVNTYSLAFREDTVYLPVRTGGCFEVVLIDSFNDATLSLVPILDREVPFEISLYPENSRLRARFCWKPGCTFINEAVGVQVKGISKPRCSDSIVIVRRLLIRAYEPEGNRAPVIRRPVDNPVTLAAGVPACWGYVISDPDSVTRLFAQGRGALFEPPLKDAFQVRIEQTGDNPLSVTVCLTPTCEYRLDKYVLYLEAIDSTLCTRVESVTDTLSINIGDCGLQIPNVFTPNADGINDVFEPFFKQAIAGYEIIIYDRWGQLIRQLSNQGWNGQTQTNEKAPAGTYYYVLRYYLASQPETPLVIERTGYVDLVY